MVDEEPVGLEVDDVEPDCICLKPVVSILEVLWGYVLMSASLGGCIGKDFSNFIGGTGCLKKCDSYFPSYAVISKQISSD